MRDGSATVRSESVSRVFHQGRHAVHAVREISLTVEGGCLTVIRGRSGSGKTTLMNLLGTLDRPTAGRVFLGDTDLTAVGAAERDEIRRTRMGFIFQSVALISAMSAYENVEFMLRLAGFPARDRRDRAEQYLHLVGLHRRMAHRPGELSGGEQQRVAIARAIGHGPDVVFADEPTAELDTHTGLQVVKLFRDLVEREGLTVVMSTHDPEMASVADRVYTLEDGILIEDESWKKLVNGTTRW